MNEWSSSGSHTQHFDVYEFFGHVTQLDGLGHCTPAAPRLERYKGCLSSCAPCFQSLCSLFTSFPSAPPFLFFWQGQLLFPSSGWACADKLTWDHFHFQLLILHFNLLCLLLISRSHQATSELRSHRNWNALLREHVILHTLCLPNSGSPIPGQSKNHAEVEGWTWDYLFLPVQNRNS